MIFQIGKNDCHCAENKLNPVKKRSLTGFTLIEILISVVILMVIAGLTIPNFGNVYKNFKLKKSVDDLSFLMRYAQSRAVVKNAFIQLEFSSDYRSYWLNEGHENNNFEKNIEYQQLDGRYGKVFKVAPIVELESQVSKVHFAPNGQVDRLRLYVCLKENCQTISTMEQRGTIKTYDTKVE